MKPFDFTNEKYHMGHLIWDALRIRPDAICQIDAATDESETNASVLRRSKQLARCFRRFGAKPGDVLALGGRNHLDLHIPYYAALMNGMPIGGVDPQFKYSEIKAHFKVSLPKVAFCQKESVEDHLQAITDLGLETRLICFDEGEHSLKRFIQEFDDQEDDSEFEPLEFDLDNIYGWLMSTGGTTGVIKLAAFKHRTFFAKVAELKNMFKMFPVADTNDQNSPNRPGLHLMPVQWISSFFNTLFSPVMHLTKIMTSAPATTEHVIDIINKYRPVTTLMGPSIASAIINSEKECDFTCFDNINLLGAKIHKDILLELRRRMRPGAHVVETYGQTENLGPILRPNPLGPVGNCGYYPFDQPNIKLIDPETGKEITEPNVTGEMWTSKAMPRFTEYYNNPIETANAFTEDGWYKTGDLLYQDKDGNYYFVERLKMLIKYRSYHIISNEIEEVIRELPGVLDVCVTSVPHKEDGDHPVACVVKRNGALVTAQEIKDLVASKLSDSQKLRGGVVFMDEIPLTSTGKVARGKLQQLVLAAQRE